MALPKTHFDADKAGRAAAFIESLPHIKGELAKQKISLIKFQLAFVHPLFGTVYENGRRVYRIAYLELPRKNAKTTLAVAIGLYLFVADEEEGAEIYSSGQVKAKDRGSGVSFSIAMAMVEATPALRRRIRIFPGAMRMEYPETNSIWQALPRKVPANWGLNVHGGIFDEVHAEPDDDNWNLMETSMSGRTQPLMLGLTTAGMSKHTLCWRLHKRALRAAKRPRVDPSFLGMIYAADENDDWTKRRTWRKANPLYPVSPTPEAMQSAVDRAKKEPEFVNTFKRLHLNVWTSAFSQYIPMDRWFACPDRPAPEKLLGRKCYGGLDIATVLDIAAFVLLFPPEGDSPYWDMIAHYFVPERNIEKRVRRDNVPYDVWAREGFINATPGNAIDHETIDAVIDAEREKYKLVQIGYDRYEAIHLAQHFATKGIEAVPVGMGWVSMDRPMRDMLALIVEKKLRHGDHPVTNWMADNLQAKTSPTGAVQPDKGASEEKIDGIVALCCALFVAASTPQKRESVYNTRGVLVLDTGGLHA